MKISINQSQPEEEAELAVTDYTDDYGLFNYSVKIVEIETERNDSVVSKT